MSPRPSTPLRLAPLLLAGAAVIGVTGCHRSAFVDARGSGDRPLQVASRLDCPDRSGGLRRTDAAADGRSCRYSGADGEEVTLAFLTLDGRPPEDALKATEAGLRTLVPAAVAPEPGSLRPAGDDATKVSIATRDDDDDGDKDGDKRDEARRDDDGRNGDRDAGTPGVPSPPRPPEAPQIDRDWSASRHGRREHVRVNLPFIHIEAGDSGAHVRAFGADINASEDGATVRGPWGTHINASHGGAEMRFGEVGAARADLTYIIASDKPGPQGYRAAAYVAKGPVAGPLVLATSRSQERGDGAHDEAIHDLKHLVNLNVRTR